MHLSLIIDPSRTWPQMLALARHVEAAGWHAVYTCDHFMPYDPSGSPVDGAVLECWTSLTALALQTQGIRLGTLVMSNTYRHAAVVANMAATLDTISGGRVILGVGAGWQENEHLAYGIPLPPPRDRVAALDEACAVIRSLLDLPRTTYAGAAYSLADAPCDPKPVQKHLPLLVGGGGEQLMLRIAAKHADVWHSWMDAPTLARKSALLDRYCEEIDRDPREVLRATGGTIDPHERTDATIERLVALRDAGAAEFIVIDDAAGVPFPRALEQLDLLSERVRPACS